MTSRMVMSYALTAGLTYTEALHMAPGLILDLFLYRRNYDDTMHGVQRKKEPKCFD